MKYDDDIPAEYRKTQPGRDQNFTIEEFVEKVTPETLAFLLMRLAYETKDETEAEKEYRTLILKQAAETLKMDVEELTRQVNEITLERKAANVDPEPIYFADKDGYLCKMEEIENFKGEIRKIRDRLANFTARIGEVITEDNGQEIIKKYLLEGQCANHPLPRIEVLAAQFPSMGWLHQWGSGVIIEPGYKIKDTVRHAIQVMSKETRQTLIFTHTGWREIEGNRVYLSHGGALGGDNVNVQLSKELSRYSLPSKPGNEIEAIRASLSFLDIGSRELTLPLFTAVYLAPLISLLSKTPHPVNFSFYAYGPTGTYKTTLAIIALAHFGDFNATGLSNFEDTENYLEYRSFLLKDTLMVLDDYYPGASRLDAIKKEQLVQRLIRAFSNRTARGRLNSDSKEKGRYEPGGLLLITGEEIASLQSTIARLFVIEIHKNDVDSEKLSKLQAKVNLLPHAMASYILWLREHYNRIMQKISLKFEEERKKATGGTGHRKLAEHRAFLALTLTLVSAWLVNKGIFTKADRDALVAEGREIFQRLTEKHGE